MNILNLVLALLPEAEQLASIFIHNPASQHTFSVVVSTAEALAPVVAGLSKTAAPAAAAPPAAEAIPAGVPSAHPSN